VSEDRTPYGDEDIEAPAQHVVEYNITDAQLAKLAKKHENVDASEDYAGAKEAAKECQVLRKTLEDKRVFLKADALAYGRAVDGEAKRIREKIEAVENPIKAQLKEIDDAEKLAEAARVAAIESKLEQVQAFANDRYDLTLEQLNERLETLGAFEITEEIFEEFFKQAGLLRLEAETKLSITIGKEKERLAEEEAQRMAAEENERRQKELDERQAKMDAEDAERRAKQEAEDAERKAKQDEEDRIAREKQAAEDAVRQKELDEQQAELDQQAEEQLQEQERIDAEKAERYRKEAEEAEAKLAAQQAPDVEKLRVFRGKIECAICESPMLETEAGKRIMLDINKALQALKLYITGKMEELK